MTENGYIQRVNAAIDYIVTHLDGPLPLEDVAAAAFFSPFHFHRVFNAIIGETLGQFVKRVRLERALYIMSHDRKKPLLDVAVACGFSSAANFSRSFKQHYGVAPSAFRLDEWRASKRDDLVTLVRNADGQLHLDKLPDGTNPDGFAVTICNHPARTVAYIRVLNPYHGGVTEAVERLLAWARENDVADGQWLGYMWEDPNIVALEDCRYDAAVVIDAPVHGLVGGEISLFEFPPMQVASVTMRGDIALEMRALDWVFGNWLPSSGYVPDDQPCFEAWHGEPFAHGFEHFEIDVQIPVKRG